MGWGSHHHQDENENPHIQSDQHRTESKTSTDDLRMDGTLEGENRCGSVLRLRKSGPSIGRNGQEGHWVGEQPPCR